MRTLGRLLIFYAIAISSALWARYKVAKARPGWHRLVLVGLLIVVNCFLPFIFDAETEFTLYACTLLLMVWLANFKLLALALDRGALSGSNLSTSQFIILYILPVTPQSSGDKKMPRVKSNNRLEQSAGSSLALATKWTTKLVLLLGIVYLLANRADWMPSLVIELAEAFMLYCFLGVLMDGPAAVIGSVFAMPISPHFDAPYLSQSISEFWSKRWNLTVGNALRVLCYDPIHEGRLVQSDSSYKVNKTRSGLAVCWTFVVSGLMHEFLVWYMDPRAMTGEWLCFFAIQGPLLFAEALTKRWSRRQRLKLAQPLKILLSCGIELLLAHWLFFPTAVRNRLDYRFFDDVGRNLHYLKDLALPQAWSTS